MAAKKALKEEKEKDVKESSCGEKEGTQQGRRGRCENGVEVEKEGGANEAKSGDQVKEGSDKPGGSGDKP